MGYFPFFVDIEGKEGLIVGGGLVALRKIERLLPFHPHLTVAAPEILPEIAALKGITLLRQPFAPELLANKFFAIAATDDPHLNHTVSELCRERNILINVVDDKNACTFLFPALVQEGKLTVGISTGGASPSAAVYVKEQLAEALPSFFAEILDFLSAQRAFIQQQIPEEKNRTTFFADLFAVCMEKGRPLTSQELDELLFHRSPNREEPNL